VKEARLLFRHAAIGASYETLLRASALAELVARNPVLEDSRRGVAELLRSAFAAFAAGGRADIIHFKALYRFARDEFSQRRGTQEGLVRRADRGVAEEEPRLLHEPGAALVGGFEHEGGLVEEVERDGRRRRFPRQALQHQQRAVLAGESGETLERVGRGALTQDEGVGVERK